MIQLEPGSLIQYQKSNSLALAWPAVICTDDMAPEAMLQTRPYGDVHVTLVLVLGEELTFRWARAAELSEYDPFVPFTHETVVERTPGLGDAYEMANNALEASLDLEYWRQQTMHLTDDYEMEDSASGSDTDSSSDLELQEAIRLSQESYYGSRPTVKVTKISRGLPTPCWSPPKSAENTDGRRTVIAQQKVLGSFERPLAPAHSRMNSSLVPIIFESHKMPDSIRYGKTPWFSDDAVVDLTGDVGTSNPKSEKPTTKPILQQPSLLDDAWNNLNKTLLGLTSDTVDGEISESKQFVRVLVGPTEEIRMLQHQSIWNRQYFRDPRWGLNHFDHIDGLWQLQHPALPDIDPSDFDFAAEYLESDGFGIRFPHGEAETSAAYAQCRSAWAVADQLGMHDLLDHIVDKLEYLIIDPHMRDVMRFASQVYDSFDDMDMPAHFRLKEYLAMFMASNWWVYIRDEALSEEFIERLQQLPELERDIYERRVRALEERLAEEEEEDGDDDEGEDGEEEEESGENMET